MCCVWSLFRDVPNLRSEAAADVEPTREFRVLLVDVKATLSPWEQSFRRLRGIYGQPTNWLHQVALTGGSESMRPTAQELNKFNFFFFHRYPFQYSPFFLPQMFPKRAFLNHIPALTSWFIEKRRLMQFARAARLTFVPDMWDLPLTADDAEGEELVTAKAPTHRGVHLISVSSARNATKSAAAPRLAQRFLRSPLLIDGAKFDVGAYVLFLGGSAPGGVVSLRTLLWDDFSLRFCSFDYPGRGQTEASSAELLAAPPGALFVDERFRGFWNLPSLRRNAGLGAKAALGLAIGQERLAAIDRGIAAIAANISKEALLRSADAIARYGRSGNHFWELVRFDCLVQVDLRVWVVEINMSPNMIPHHTSNEGTPHDDATWRSLLMDTTLAQVASWATEGSAFQVLPGFTEAWSGNATSSISVLGGSQRPKWA